MNEKVMKVLKMQDEGLSRHEIKDYLGYKRLDSLTKYMKKRNFEIINDKYVLMTSSVSEKNSIKQKVEMENINQNELMTNVTMKFIDEFKNKLKNEIKDEIKDEILNIYTNKYDDISHQNRVIEINNGVEITYQNEIKDQEEIRTTIRISKEIWFRFEKMIQEKKFSKKDLLSEALYNYLKKYNY